MMKNQEPDATWRALLETVLTLGEEIGFEALTVEKIARRSQMAKTTLYRRWPNVWAMVMDAFLVEINTVAPITEAETAKESFAQSMRLLASAYRGRPGRILRPLLGQAQLDPVLREAVATRWVEPRRRHAREIIRRAMARGELEATLDPDLLLDVLYGPIYHRILAPYPGGDLSDAFVAELVDLVFGHMARPG